MSIVSVCSCCKEKSFNILFCFVKVLRCRECYQEVCKNCWSSETCHTCYVRDRPDANSVERLKELESDELERLMKTLHLEPSKKSENDWINMIAQHCGLPMKIAPPQFAANHAAPPTMEANGHQLNQPSKKKTETAKTNGVKSPIRTHAIMSVNGVEQNRSTLHGHIIHELASRDDDFTTESDKHDSYGYDWKVREEETESGIHNMDDSPPSNNRSKFSSSSYESSYHQNVELDRKITIQPATHNVPAKPVVPNTEVPKVETAKVQRTASVSKAEVIQIEDLNEIDVKILKNIEQRRPLTESEKLSLEKYERDQQNVVKRPVFTRSNASVELQRSNDTEDAAPNNVKDFITQYGGSSSASNGGKSTRNQLIAENIQVIEIKNDEKLKTKISINPPPPEPVKKSAEKTTKLVEPVRKLVEPGSIPVKPVRKPVEPASIPVKLAEPARKHVEPASKPLKLVEPASKPVKLVKPVSKPVKHVQPVRKPVEPVIKLVEPLKKPVELVPKPAEQSNRPIAAVRISKQPIVVVSSAKQDDLIAEVHRKNVTASWQKVVNVNMAVKRDSNISRKEVEAASMPLTKPIEIVSKDPEIAAKVQPSNRTAVPVTKTPAKQEKLSKESTNILLSSIRTESDIQKMDILQMRKILRQINTKAGQNSIQREELVKELSRIWREAIEFRKNDNSSKEVLIIVSNQPLRNVNNAASAAATSRANGAPVKAFNFSTISSEEQIRKLNTFQLKSLLTEDGLLSDVIGVYSKEELVKKAIQRWHNRKPAQTTTQQAATRM